MLLRNPDKGLRRGVRLAPALLPVLERAHRDAEKLRELRLAQARFFARAHDGVGVDGEPAPGAARLELAHPLQDLPPEVALFLPFRELPVSHLRHRRHASYGNAVQEPMVPAMIRPAQAHAVSYCHAHAARMIPLDLLFALSPSIVLACLWLAE